MEGGFEGRGEGLCRGREGICGGKEDIFMDGTVNECE